MYSLNDPTLSSSAKRLSLHVGTDSCGKMLAAAAGDYLEIDSLTFQQMKTWLNKGSCTPPLKYDTTSRIMLSQIIDDMGE